MKKILIIIITLVSVMNLSFSQNSTQRNIIPLFRALHIGDFETFKKLIENGADVNSHVPGGVSLLTYACGSIRRLEFIQYLLSKGANANNKAGGYTPLMFASQFGGPIEITKILLKHGAKVNEQVERDGFTPLLFAIKYKNYIIAKMLLKHGANPDLADKTGEKPIDYARKLKLHLFEQLLKGTLPDESKITTLSDFKSFQKLAKGKIYRIKLVFVGAMSLNNIIFRDNDNKTILDITRYINEIWSSLGPQRLKLQYYVTFQLVEKMVQTNPNPMNHIIGNLVDLDRYAP